MYHKRLTSILVLAAAAFSAVSLVGADTADAANPYRVRARIRAGAAVEAKGEYRELMRGTTLVQRWNVELNGATPGTAYTVQLNGSTIGIIVTNALGNAEQEFRTAIVDNNPTDEEPPIPTDFPRVLSGDTLTVVGIGTASFVQR